MPHSTDNFESTDIIIGCYTIVRVFKPSRSNAMTVFEKNLTFGRHLGWILGLIAGLEADLVWGKGAEVKPLMIISHRKSKGTLKGKLTMCCKSVKTDCTIQIQWVDA